MKTMIIQAVAAACVTISSPRICISILNFIRIPSPFFADFGNGLLCITDPSKLFFFVFEGISTGNLYVLVLVML